MAAQTLAELARPKRIYLEPLDSFSVRVHTRDMTTTYSEQKSSELTCTICQSPTVYRSRICRYCQTERQPFLALPHAEILATGCVGQLQLVDGATCLAVVWCGCGNHRTEA